MSWLRNIFYALPPRWRFVARRLYYFPLDFVEGISGKRDALTPPRGLIYTGSGDFRAQGNKLLQYFISDAGLQPQHDVLDIGSGIGRIAVPLTTYLNESGSYEGFDVVETGVDWCKQHISSRFSNFNFEYISLENDLYRSQGTSAAVFTFPYTDASFDFVVLSSVFTHMLPEEVANYLKEIGRVLRPGGCCFATFFIWNEQSAQVDQLNPAFAFPYDHKHYRLMDERVTSANVAYAEDYLHSLIADANLQLHQTFYGYWSGREKAQCKDFQDILLLKK
ncbi:MAG: hypothetical protein DHS20C18_45180 [Saprospiraceae bacterium]|nr:MAG: hypothetical protein DHS20C18_45180 [Saprospiraceae bacterium]